MNYVLMIKNGLVVCVLFFGYVDGMRPADEYQFMIYRKIAPSENLIYKEEYTGNVVNKTPSKTDPTRLENVPIKISITDPVSGEKLKNAFLDTICAKKRITRDVINPSHFVFHYVQNTEQRGENNVRSYRFMFSQVTKDILTQITDTTVMSDQPPFSRDIIVSPGELNHASFDLLFLSAGGSLPTPAPAPTLPPVRVQPSTEPTQKLIRLQDSLKDLNAKLLAVKGKLENLKRVLVVTPTVEPIIIRIDPPIQEEFFVKVYWDREFFNFLLKPNEDLFFVQERIIKKIKEYYHYEISHQNLRLYKGTTDITGDVLKKIEAIGIKAGDKLTVREVRRLD